MHPRGDTSGNFAQQIQHGAPFAVLLSADESYGRPLVEAGCTEDEGVLYAIARIGLFLATGPPVKADDDLRDLAAVVRDGHVVRFAVANPEHALYGRPTREALQHAGPWDVHSQSHGHWFDISEECYLVPNQRGPTFWSSGLGRR